MYVIHWFFPKHIDNKKNDFYDKLFVPYLNNEDIYIVTTKNRFATEALLKHYKISVREIFANDEIMKRLCN